jgi:four helix bundle protein
MRDFKTLLVWQKAHQLSLATYQATTSFPTEERYGLVSQIRRACSSIPANLAEGCGRNSDAEFAHFASIAMGSASELEYEFLLAFDLSYLSESQYQVLNKDLIEVKRMLNTFIRKLKANG